MKVPLIVQEDSGNFIIRWTCDSTLNTVLNSNIDINATQTYAFIKVLSIADLGFFLCLLCTQKYKYKLLKHRINAPSFQSKSKKLFLINVEEVITKLCLSR